MLKPLGSNIAFKRDPGKTLYGGEGLIICPDNLVFDSFECTVLAVGPGSLLYTGIREPMPVHVGQKVAIYQEQGVHFKDGIYLGDISVVEALIEE